MRSAVVIPFFAGLLLAAPAAAKDKPCPASTCTIYNECKREEPAPKVCQLFARTQAPVQGPFVMERWQISSWQTETKIPHQGLLIVHVCAGSLIVGTGSAQQEWSEGTFWSVPADQPLIVHTARDSAVLQTVDIIMP